MQGRGNYPSSLTELAIDECWHLLGTRPFGRISWSGPEGITVIPVNYVVEHDTLVLRTTPYSDLAQHADDIEVGFQVDHIDEESRGGWSVLVRGRCHRADLAPSSTPEVWVDGMRVLALRINVRSLSGRRIRPFFEPARTAGT